MVESLENVVRDLLHDASVRSTEKFADLIQFVDRGDLVLVRRHSID